MGLTAKLGLRWPERTAAPDLQVVTQNLANDVDDKLGASARITDGFTAPATTGWAYSGTPSLRYCGPQVQVTINVVNNTGVALVANAGNIANVGWGTIPNGYRPIELATWTGRTVNGGLVAGVVNTDGTVVALEASDSIPDGVVCGLTAQYFRA